MCKELDESHTFQSTDGAEPSPERLALDAHNNSVNDDKRLPHDVSGPLSQKELSKAIDARSYDQLAVASDSSTRAHLSLVSASGAGLYLHATPCKAARLNNEPALFIAMLQRRLRISFSDQDHECPCCDGVMDRFGDLALVCCGGGDRTRRHNLLRNSVYYAAASASLHPELERPGLLPERPIFGSLCENGGSVTASASTPSARRPADIYIPRWRAGPPAAWDFAVTSGLRVDAISDSIGDPDAAPTRYEDFKCSHQGTKVDCQSQGITFVPMVMEATGGGWGRVARGVWSELAKSLALASGELQTEHSSATQLLQRLAMTLHRENARSCLKRLAG